MANTRCYISTFIEELTYNTYKMSFESIIEDVKSRAAAADSLGNTIKFSIGEGRFIYLDGTGADNIVSSEDKDADCLVEIEEEDLKNILSGELNPMGAFMSGKLKVKGDMSVALKLQSVLS